MATTLLAGWLRWPSNDPATLFIDEPLTWDVVRKSSASDYLAWRHHFEHPPLSFMLADASARLLGGERSLRALRMPSFLFGTLCVPLAFAVGSLLAGRGAGLAMAVLAALDPIQVEQSRVARMYPLFTASLLASAVMFTWLLLRWRRLGAASAVPGRARELLTLPWAWPAAGVLVAAQWWSAGLGFATVAGMIVLIASIVVATARRDRRAAATLASGVLIAMFVAALATHVGLLARLKTGIPDFTAPRGAGERLAMMSVSTRSLANVGPAGWAVLAAAAGGIVWLARRRESGAVTLLLPAAAAMNLLAIFVALRTYHSLSPRYLIALSPVIWLGLAGLTTLRSRWRGAGWVVVCVVAAVWAGRDLRLGKYAGVDPRTRYAASIVALPPGQAVVYLPGYMSLSAEMLQRPGDAALQKWVNDGAKGDPPPVSAPSLVVWQLGTNRRDTRDAFFGVVERLSRRFDAPVDRAALEAALGDDRPLVVRLSRGRADVLSQPR